MIIDCDSCEVRGPACTDCVVTFLTIPMRPRMKATHLKVDDDQVAAMEALAAAGMVPPLRLVSNG